MGQKEMIAMLLAGGEGKRLGVLTKDLAKPAVHFGGKYRIIDFTLSNCMHSGIDTVGVLTQYQPLVLNRYLGIGSPWGLDRSDGGMAVLPPYVKSKGGDWYKGTANAIYQNMGFIDRYEPEYVLIISGDHIYKMDYEKMLEHHKSTGADVTVAGLKVDIKEASRFGTMILGEGTRIADFEEKPKHPVSDVVSMGVYIFNWKVLQKYLIRDEADRKSSHDFGKDIIPAMLEDDISLHMYPFKGYWKDVGTIESLWEAHMDLLGCEPQLDLGDDDWRIYSTRHNRPAHYVSPAASIRESMITEGCVVEGEVSRSVLFSGVEIGEGCHISESVVMPGAIIGAGCKVYRTIVGENAVLEAGVVLGSPEGTEIGVVGSDEKIARNHSLQEVQQP